MAADDRWCILWTTSGRTLSVAKSLAAAGLDIWTPVRTVKRPAPGNRGRYVTGQRRIMVEVALPILPGFVFARAGQLTDLLAASLMPHGPHLPFHILQVGDRVPVVGEIQLVGLRIAERDAEAATAAERATEREAAIRDAGRRARAQRLGTERARRKALRQERKMMRPGDKVTVDETPALAGLIGTVVEGRGASAVIHFGGSLTMTVEAWLVHPASVDSAAVREGAAA